MDETELDLELYEDEDMESIDDYIIQTGIEIDLYNSQESEWD